MKPPPGRIPDVREVSPLLIRIRHFLLGRNNSNALRFQQGLAERPGPPAHIPEGPHHKISSNHYFARDARREVKKPRDLGLPALGDGSAALDKRVKSVTPGRYYNYSD
ncbi:NDUFA7 [Lepeophtheirus salmonis]|uniref:NADH dehydrogenase [ubiquinone] 1 alpha subcomplex subunit 7 n=1 Tax=Lepeophtheirus salmonis TaxID=72036 RepID=A0A7R8H980_LEPSM|nr:NDUFA7 [Lepeophtheirus salmonis]CAF2944518.1 NDUFA7 [Lepeophtheirus salmonis]